MTGLVQLFKCTAINCNSGYLLNCHAVNEVNVVNSVTLVRIGEETDLGRRNILEIYSGNKPIHRTRMSSITAVDNTVLI